jgi:hypothetical protein
MNSGSQVNKLVNITARISVVGLRACVYVTANTKLSEVQAKFDAYFFGLLAVTVLPIL